MSKVLRLAVSVVLLGWVAWHTDWQQVGAAFARLRLQWWLAAVGVLVLAQLVSAVRWQLLARPLGFHRPLWQMMAFYFIGMYFNLVLPTSVGGDVVRAWYLNAQSGRRLKAFMTVLLDRLSGLMVLLAMAVLGVVLSPLELPAWIAWSVGALAACALCGLAVLPLLYMHKERAPWKIPQMLSALAAVRSPRLLLATTLLSVVVQVASVVLVWLIGCSLDAAVPGAYYWVLVPMVSLLTLLPVSVNGMGVREGAMVLFLAPLGVPHGTALMLAFLWFAVSAVASLAGGLVYLYGHFPSPAAAAALTDEVQDGPVHCNSYQGRAGQSPSAA